MKRRELIKASLLAPVLFGLDSRLSFAQGVAGAARAPVVFVILRGGWDGLNVLVPYGESAYSRQRGELALGVSDGIHKLDGMFALNPALTNLSRWYAEKALLPYHAVATPYRERSHFDAQDILESGLSKTYESREGWLNRALSLRKGAKALGVGGQLPLVLRGANPADNWSPDPMPDLDQVLLEKLGMLYQHDDMFETVLSQSEATESMAMSMSNSANRGRRAGAFPALAKAAGSFVAHPNGPEVAVLELGGWDTHANQGTTQGALFNRLQELDNGLAELRKALGGQWDNTAIIIASEFGRTVKANGTRGTDHGTATCAFVAGGNVSGGKVISDWPGLANGALYQDRDLKPTMDIRDVFAATLEKQWSLERAEIMRRVFTA